MSSIKYTVNSSGMLLILNPVKTIENTTKDLNNKTDIKCEFVKRFLMNSEKSDTKILCYEYKMSRDSHSIAIDFSKETEDMKTFSAFCIELYKKNYELI